MKRYLPGIFFLLACGLVVLLCSLLFAKNELTQERAEQMLAQSLVGDSYRFTLEADITLPEGERRLLEVSGAVDGDSSRLSGTALGADVQLIFTENELYQRNAGGAWSVVHLADAGEAAQLMAELFPAQAFAVESVSSFTYLGQSKQGKATVQQAELAVLSQGWVGKFCTQPVITITVDRRAKQLLSLSLTAQVAGEQESTLTLRAQFFDQGAPMEIAAPE